MALNKSNKNTPTSRSGYFTELTASAGKQTNYLVPVRIKITPKHSVAPLSDGKKNAMPKFKPVLVKDLLRSTEKGKFNTTVRSVSTQKKKINRSKVSESYLNTQSCYKPKNSEEEATFLDRKSIGVSKVRRQLYQNLDPSQKASSESSEIASNVNKAKKTAKKSSLVQTKIRKSMLLPPNSIKNIIIKKSEACFKAPDKQSKTSSKNTTVSKVTKKILPVSETAKPKKNNEKSFNIYEDEANMDTNLSSPEVDIRERKAPPEMRDNSTMTSPSLNKASSKISTNIDTLERPSVIMSPSKSKSSLNVINAEPLCTEMQNLNINTNTCNCAAKIRASNDTSPKIDFDNMTNMNQNNLSQMKTFLEQSIQASEDQIIKLKQLLSFVNNMSNTAKKADTNVNDFNKFNEEDDASKVAVCNEDDPSETSAETITLNLSSPVVESDNNLSENRTESEQKQSTEFQRLPLPMKILISDDDANQEAKELSSEQLTEMARLSTIGEVSCEVDLSSKVDSENKENQSDYMNITIPMTPKSPKTPRRRTIATGSCDSQGRRRSARLAAKRMSLSSLSDSDSRQDSFTMLENELNVMHEKLPSKSLPASPMKAPLLTPGYAKQWDKRIERPLKEYMALKMNGTFLVTPDVKRFQSRLESTDTPQHSRKSLSRKIFMELCDLYAESPDSSK